MSGDPGETLVKATSGREALELLLKMDVAVVLMDVSMPELDGFELAKMIRQHPRFQNGDHLHLGGASYGPRSPERLRTRRCRLHFGSDYPGNYCAPKSACLPSCTAEHNSCKRSTNELRRLSHSLMTAQDEERRRIARELHDGLGQDLTAAKMMLGALIQPQQSHEAKEQAVREANVMMDHAIQQVLYHVASVAPTTS